MGDPNPRDMLKLYRAESHPFTDEQRVKFMAMPVADRLELLFYMLMNTNAIMQQIHQQLQPGAHATQGMPDVPREN